MTTVLLLGDNDANDKNAVSNAIDGICKANNCNMIQKARAIIPFDTQIVAAQEVRASIHDYTDFTVDE